MARKVALITGAAKGIGKATALAMAEAGYDLIVNYRSDQEAALAVCKAAEAAGAKALPLYADLSKMDELKTMFQKIFDVFPRVHVLVNNAGVSDEVYFLDATEANFDKVTAVDWKGLFFCAQYAARHMVENHIPGVIINVTSNQAEGCWPRASIYGPTKAAVSKFTKNAAMELAPYGVRMVAIAPGYTDIGWAADSHIREAEKLLPLGRFAQPAEIAKGIVYLASDDAAYMTGSVLTLDGGATLPVVACNDFVK